jgi:Domain of unknown function (DUF4440)
MIGHLSFLAILAALQSPPPTDPDRSALTTAVAAADARFFDLFFNRCEPDQLRTMVTGDFEMYHDRGGVVALSADQFVEDYRRACTARAAPDAWRSRRALIDSSLHVDPVPGFGAIEEGEHLFYERRGDGPERLAGRARFVQLWQQTPDGWRLARVFSYAHGAAEEPAAPR